MGRAGGFGRLERQRAATRGGWGGAGPGDLPRSPHATPFRVSTLSLTPPAAISSGSMSEASGSTIWGGREGPAVLSWARHRGLTRGAGAARAAAPWGPAPPHLPLRQQEQQHLRSTAPGALVPCSRKPVHGCATCGGSACSTPPPRKELPTPPPRACCSVSGLPRSTLAGRLAHALLTADAHMHGAGKGCGRAGPGGRGWKRPLGQAPSGQARRRHWQSTQSRRW